MKTFYQDRDLTLYEGDALEVLRSLPEESVQCAVTSPPYWGLRDYGVSGQLGLEPIVPEVAYLQLTAIAQVLKYQREEVSC